MNQLKINSIALVLITLGLSSVKAQFTIKRSELENNKLQEKTIYFELKELSDKQLKKFKDHNTIENLKIQYQEENTILNKTLEDHWINSEKITGLSTDEIETRIENKEETWYITFYKQTDKFFDKRVHKQNYYFYYQHYILSLFKNNHEVLSIPLVNDFISEVDIHFAIHMMQDIVQNIERYSNMKDYSKTINQNSQLISKKTLLIPQSYTAYSEDYIKQYYKGNIKITEDQEIIEAIHRNDSNYAYLLINMNHLSEKPTFNHFIIDCATNSPLFLYAHSSSYSKTGIQKGNMPILKREIQFLFISHFKKYNSKI